ncbi:MAG: type II secretion system F family protein [Marmoricola sp.]
MTAIPAVAAWVAVACVAGALFLVVAVLLFGGRGDGKPTLEDHFNSYGPSASGPAHRVEATAPRESLADTARSVAKKALENNRGLEAAIAQRLESAGMGLKAPEWLILHGAIALTAGFVGLLLGSGNPLLIILFLAFGAVGPWLYLGLKRDRRVKAFNSGLADTLQLMSGSLSAGLSLQQSLDTVVREGGDPIAGEFRRAIVEARIGVEIEDALDGIADRMGSKDFGWVVMAIRIQRRVGGNLAELLLTVAATLREREYLRRHVRALSAEGRLSCWILGGLPPAFMAYLTLTKPDYMHPMFTTPVGWAMCAGIAVLLSVGIFWMSKVVKVEL